MTVYLRSYNSKGKIRSITLYSVWRTMRQRCKKPNATGYKNYGGRGISICKEWDDYSVFRSWAISADYRKGLTIDRIDNDGNYEPDNCKWSTRMEQNRNQGLRRDNKSGIPGVRLNKRRNKWRVNFYINRKLTTIYWGDDFFEACCAKKSAELRYWRST